MSAEMTQSLPAYGAGKGISPEFPYPAQYTPELCVVGCLDACGLPRMMPGSVRELNVETIDELEGIPLARRWAYAVLVPGTPVRSVEVAGYHRTNGICVPVLVKDEGVLVLPRPPTVMNKHRWTSGAIAALSGLAAVFR